MNLRVMFPARQLLSLSISTVFFATASAVMLTTVPSASAQAPAAPTGNDVVTLKTNPPQQKTGVLITGVVNGRVMVREGAGEIGYDVNQIESIRKAAPPEYAQGMKLIDAGDAEKALPLVKAVADRYKGLPTPWAQDCTAAVGNLYLSLNKIPEAEIAIADFKKAYGNASPATALAISMGEARIAASKRDFAKARLAAQDVTKDAMTKKNITRAESQTFGQAYFILGQIAEGENKLPEAMENYSRTVAIFYQDRSVVADAQKRIDQLRQKGIATP